jgi:hypothetical protein
MPEEKQIYAVCFACGKTKASPLVRCKFCEAKPISSRDKINSMAISNHCLNQKHLKAGSDYIRQYHKLPKINEKVIEKATKLVKAIPERPDDRKKSFDFSSSFFNFPGLTKGNDRGETVRVHSIGKPKNIKKGEDARGMLGNKESTYQLLHWKLGTDISIEDADNNVDDDGDLYIWYRFMGDDWTYKHISKEKFNSLQAMEG